MLPETGKFFDWMIIFEGGGSVNSATKLYYVHVLTKTPFSGSYSNEISRGGVTPREVSCNEKKYSVGTVLKIGVRSDQGVGGTLNAGSG